jgi:hypothetical protein
MGATDCQNKAISHSPEAPTCMACSAITAMRQFRQKPGNSDENAGIIFFEEFTYSRHTHSIVYTLCISTLDGACQLTKYKPFLEFQEYRHA